MSKHDEFITVVSGLPRSGTSMMMKMLEAAGIEAVVDGVRGADVSNPKGYYEFEPVKKLREESSWMAGATGKAVKVIYSLLYDLPTDRSYRVLFMSRRLEEVLASQRKMLAELGSEQQDAGLGDEEMAAFFQASVRKCKKWLAAQPAFEVLEIDYNQMLEDGAGQVDAINIFLGGHLDTQAMLSVVDRGLYRNRRGNQAGLSAGS